MHHNLDEHKRAQRAREKVNQRSTSTRSNLAAAAPTLALALLPPPPHPLSALLTKTMASVDPTAAATGTASKRARGHSAMVRPARLLAQRRPALPPSRPRRLGSPRSPLGAPAVGAAGLWVCGGARRAAGRAGVTEAGAASRPRGRRSTLGGPPLARPGGPRGWMGSPREQLNGAGAAGQAQRRARCSGEGPAASRVPRAWGRPQGRGEGSDRPPQVGTPSLALRSCAQAEQRRDVGGSRARRRTRAGSTSSSAVADFFLRSLPSRLLPSRALTDLAGLQVGRDRRVGQGHAQRAQRHDPEHPGPRVQEGAYRSLDV